MDLPNLPQLITPFIQKIKGMYRLVLFQTVAAAVYLADGTTVQAKIETILKAISGKTVTYVVADIAARDALTDLHVGDQAWVKDATADDTVKQGAAKYIYEGTEDEDGAITDGKWVKTAEAESMDMIHKWEDIQGKPTASVEEIDAAVASVKFLDGHELSTDEDGANLLLDGNPVGGKYAGYISVSPDDPGFEAAVEALGLADGGFVTIVSASAEEGEDGGENNDNSGEEETPAA